MSLQPQQPQQQFTIVPLKRQRTDQRVLPGNAAPAPQFDFPPAVSSMIKNHAREYAIKWCKREKIVNTLEDLADCKTHGRVPKQLVSKLKNVFNTPGFETLRTATIELAIDDQIKTNTDRRIELDDEISKSLVTLHAKLDPVLTSTGFTIDPQVVSQEFGFHLQSCKLEFLIKHRSDADKKAAKATKFAQAKEDQQQEVPITKKEKSQFINQMKSLTNELSKLKITVAKAKNQGKGNGPAKPSPKAGPSKPTKKNPTGGSKKTTKRKGGNKQDSAKARSSRG